MYDFASYMAGTMFKQTYSYESGELDPFIAAVCAMPLTFTFKHDSDERKVSVESIDYKSNGSLSIIIDEDEFKDKFPELFKE